MAAAKGVQHAARGERLGYEGAGLGKVGFLGGNRTGGGFVKLGKQRIKLRGTVTFLTQTSIEPERMAVLTLEHNVVVVLTARRRPFHNFSEFTDLQLELTDYQVLLVKSGYLSPDLHTIAKPALLALTPGVVDQDIERVTYHRWQRPRFPHEQNFVFEPTVVWNDRDEIP